MKNLNVLTAELLIESEERLAHAIIHQKEILNKAFKGICLDMLNQGEGGYTLIQRFQGVSTLDRTLEVMLEFYKASFNKEFKQSDWIKEVKPEITMIDILQDIALSIKQA